MTPFDPYTLIIVHLRGVSASSVPVCSLAYARGESLFQSVKNKPKSYLQNLSSCYNSECQHVIKEVCETCDFYMLCRLKCKEYA